MQGSPTAPAVFYIQSEVSEAQSCPFPDWSCARFNLDRGIDHLRMMNVSDYIVRSDRVKAAVARHPGLEKIATQGLYEIYRVRDNDPRYVLPLADAPHLVLGEDWKEPSYLWFRGARPEDVVPVFAEHATPEEERLFAGVSHGLPESFERRLSRRAARAARGDACARPPVITGARPGSPLLIRSPITRAGGRRPARRSGSPVRALCWSSRTASGSSSSSRRACGDRTPRRPCPHLPRVGASGRRCGSVARLPKPSRFRRCAGGEPCDGPARGRRSPSRDRRGRAPRDGGLVGAAAAVLRKVPVEVLYRDGLALFSADKLEEARPYFQAVQREAPLSTTAIHSRYFEGITYFRNDQWKEAEDVFSRLLRDFPDGLNAPEAGYHVGLSRLHQGNRQGAIDVWNLVRAKYPDSRWAEYAGERLAELQM
jgi:hypothetical protein